MRIYSTEQLGPRQSLTPEGYLLCEAVPIARTGSQLYAAHEIPSIEPGLDNLITVVREESEVFRAETIASFEGKPITVGHAFVDPESWGALAKGTLQNVRRGDGDQADLLLADVLITDAGTISLVRVDTDEKGRPVPGQVTLREVSCGYDAEYEQDRPGVAFQRNIIGNHVALVERGRAGPRCAIQDEEIQTMSTKTNVSLLQRLLGAMRTGDTALIKRTADAAEEEVEAEKKKAEDEERAEAEKKTADTIAELKKTVDALTAAIAAKDSVGPDAGQQSNPEPVDKGTNPLGDEEPDEDEKKKTADAMADTLRRAEIVAPGFKLGTTDAAPRRLADVAGVQRQVLAKAAPAFVSPLLAGRTLDALTAPELQTVFVAASELARAANNAAGARYAAQTSDAAGPVTPASINARNAEFWAKQNR